MASRAAEWLKPTPSSALEFFGLTFAVTWACWLPLVLGISTRSLAGILLAHLGTYAPSLVAVWLTARNQGDAGVRGLLGRVLQAQVAARWYVFAVTFMAAIKLVAALIHRVATGAWPAFGDFPWYFIPFVIAVSTPFQAGEEIGWRGYALPRLAERWGLARASLLLGVVWAVWHLPLFFVRGADTFGQPFLVYLLQVTALSVAFAWLYGNVHGSLLLPMVLHAAINNSKDIVPSAAAAGKHPFGVNASLVAWITVGLLWAAAAYFLIRMPRLERPSGVESDR
jgi:uncharacterized protein